MCQVSRGCISRCIYVNKGLMGAHEVDRELAILQERRSTLQKHLGNSLKVLSAGNTQQFQSQERLKQAKLKDPTSLLHKSCFSAWNPLNSTKQRGLHTVSCEVCRLWLLHMPYPRSFADKGDSFRNDDREAMAGRLSPGSWPVGKTFPMLYYPLNFANNFRREKKAIENFSEAPTVTASR